MSKLKTRLHFNRVNMQRGNPAVWTAHNSHGCYQAANIVVMHKGEILLETHFDPNGKQPRAYFKAKAVVSQYGDMVVVNV